MDDEMTLEDFEKVLRQNVEDFLAKWREGQRTQPDIYGSTLTVADWHEQFATHVELSDI